MRRETGRTPSPIRTLFGIVVCVAVLAVGLDRLGSGRPPVGFIEATREDGRAEWGGCTIVPVPQNDRTRVRNEIERAVAAYPQGLFEANVHGGVALASSIVLRGVTVGGLTYVRSQTLLVGANLNPAYDPHRAETSFHHEFSHLLMSGHAALFPLAEWRAANPPDFRYLDRYGLDTLRQGIHRLPREPARRAGFADPYGASNLQEDVAMVAETLMSNNRKILDRLIFYPRLEKKYRLLIRFYQALDPAFRPPLGWDRNRGPKTLQVRRSDQGVSSRRATTTTPAV